MKPFRTKKVGSVIRDIVSDAIRNRLQEPRIAHMTSVTRVDVSGDLEWAKVYFSVFGDRKEQDKTLAGLKHATGYVQKLLAKSLPTRQCPQLVFILDASLKKSQEVVQQIDASMSELEEDAARQHLEHPEADEQPSTE